MIVERRPALVELGEWLDRQLALRFDIDHRPPQHGTDYTVRRVVDFPLTRALAALTTITAERGATVVRSDKTWLALPVPHRSATARAMRLDGQLHVHRFGRPLPVEVIVEPWSGDRTELRLEVRTRRNRVRLPRRYFDAAHPAMGALRDEIEARAAA